MNLSMCVDLLKKTFRAGNNSGFSDFFRNAPLKQQKEILKKAAEQANEDQRRVFKQAQSKV